MMESMSSQLTEEANHLASSTIESATQVYYANKRECQPENVNVCVLVLV